MTGIRVALVVLALLLVAVVAWVAWKRGAEAAAHAGATRYCMVMSGRGPTIATTHRLAGLIREVGNVALTGFTAPKILWVRRHEPKVYAKTKHILLPKDYIRLKLTGEYAMDVADACHAVGVKTVAVTAGYIHAAPRREFYAKMDAANVDLKAFTERFYWKVCGGHLQPVLETLEHLVKETRCWTEITTLLIPGRNDADDELRRMSAWIAAGKHSETDPGAITGRAAVFITQGRGCLNCHTQVHGTNTPSRGAPVPSNQRPLRMIVS